MLINRRSGRPYRRPGVHAEKHTACSTKWWSQVPPDFLFHSCQFLSSGPLGAKARTAPPPQRLSPALSTSSMDRSIDSRQEMNGKSDSAGFMFSVLMHSRGEVKCLGGYISLQREMCMRVAECKPAWDGNHPSRGSTPFCFSRSLLD